MKTTLAIITASLLGLAGFVSGAAEPAAKPYPLKKCIVSDNTLGTMGTVQRIVHNGQEIKFCCKPCIAKFKKNPDKYLPKLR